MADFCYFCKKKISVLGLLSKKVLRDKLYAVNAQEQAAA